MTARRTGLSPLSLLECKKEEENEKVAREGLVLLASGEARGSCMGTFAKCLGTRDWNRKNEKASMHPMYFLL